MSWESYYQRASGSNVDRVLAEMSDTQRRKEEQRKLEERQRALQQFEMEQSQREAQARIVAAYMANPSAQTRAAAVQYGVPLPDYQASPEEQFNERFYGHVNTSYDPTKPLVVDPVAAGFANVDLAGKQPWMEAAGRRYTYAQPETLPASVVNAQRVSDKLDMNAEEQEKSRQYWEEFKSVKLPESQVGVTKTRAETGKIGAETRKIGEETITEREARDPNSPTAKAKGSAAGRISPAESLIRDVNARLRDNDKKRTDLQLKLAEETNQLKAAQIRMQLQIIENKIQRDLELRSKTSTQAKQFSEEDERGIAAVMAAKKLTREQAIVAIREAAKKRTGK